MDDFNHLDFVSDADGHVEIDYEGLLSEATGTLALDWSDADGPESGVGVYLWYRNEVAGLSAYVNSDQGQVSISVTGVDGEQVASIGFELDGEGGESHGEDADDDD